MILITGGTGFVGRALIERLIRERPNEVRVAVRGTGSGRADTAEIECVGDLSSATDWSQALRGVDTIVHAAARAHVMRDVAVDPLTEYRRVNVEGTLSLAKQASAQRVGRFVFVSSIKVNGESTDGRPPFLATDIPAPVDPYGVSKMEAEAGLREIAAASEMEVAIVRPPLVYGPGVKANFRTLMRLLRAGVPLPLGAIANRRSMIALDNLVDLLAVCCSHPHAANRTFLASDGEDMSTTQLLTRLGRALDSPARLIPVPSHLLTLAARLAGKEAIATRLCGSLQVDIEPTRVGINWQPPIGAEEGLKRAAESFLNEAAV